MTTSSNNRRERRSALRRAVGAPALASALAAAVALATAAPALAAPASQQQATSSQTAVTGTQWGDSELDKVSIDPTRKAYDPRRDPGSLYSITTAIGARQAWHMRDAKNASITGKGVTVAVLDSGVSSVHGLSSKLVQGPDLSLESNNPAWMAGDTFGHGTHMASIIGASDPVLTTSTGEPVSLDGRAQLGVAPGAQLLAVKLANTDGSTDVSQVIAGIDWVVEHRNDNGMNVRVINLSYGTDSQQSYRTDPLAAAIERAWQRGIVVVASAGNEGADSAGLNDPAYDPYAIAVGSTSPNTSNLGQILATSPAAWQTWLRPAVSDYSSRGTAERSVDIAAPGKSVTGLRAPHSSVDTQHREGRVLNDYTGRLFRGSGTSQAAAVVSGAAALLLQADPTLTPDAVKAALTSTATAVQGAGPQEVGAGQINVGQAVDLVRHAAAGSPSAKATISKKQTWPTSNGLGSLNASRGGYYLVDPDTGQELNSDMDVQSQRWDGQAWNRAAAKDATWSGGYYMGARWSGDSWKCGSWDGARWSGARWSGARWSSTNWDGARWSGARWSGARWSSDQYDGARWS